MSLTLTETDSSPQNEKSAALSPEETLSGDTSPSSGRKTAGADASQLQDRFPEWMRTSPTSVKYTLLLGLLFVFFSFRPLWHSDLWSHLAYGRLMWETGRLPAWEPFLPLAEGVPLTDTAWLSQLAGYAAYALAGPTALQFLYAAAITFCLALLAWRFHRQTGRFGLVAAGLGVFLLVQWQALFIIRPQLAGLCCFVLLLSRLTNRRLAKTDWWLIPLLMAAWANLHGSFVTGLLLLGTFCFGRALDVWRRTGRFIRLLRDARTRRLFLLTELAAAAVLLNPYGIALYGEVFRIAGHVNLQDLLDWQPLTLRMRQGQAAFAVTVLLMMLVRLSPRRITATEVLWLTGMGAASWWTSRMLVWWAPVAAWFFVRHAEALWKSGLFRRHRFHQRTETKRAQNTPSLPLPRRRSLWTVASLGIGWIFFAVTPFGSRLLHGVEPDINRVVSEETPVRATDYLRKHPPGGLLFTPSEWGGYVVFAGPPRVPVFATSQVHLIPPVVWQDSLRIDAGAVNVLDYYGVQTVLANPRREQELISALQRSPEWKLVFADERSLLFQRQSPQRQ